jgi:pimeloyl-ACP methyl ester carboxylesterase
MKLDCQSLKHQRGRIATAMLICGSALLANAEAKNIDASAVSGFSVSEDTGKSSTGHFAKVNGLSMYYEVHGNGRPIVLLHGGLATIDTTFGEILPALARSGRVIAIEQQGHGHTGDIDRAMTVQQMVDDTAALLHQLKIEDADVFGYSLGGMIALGLAIQHPELVRKVAVICAPYSFDGFLPEVQGAIRSSGPEGVPKGLYEAYERSAQEPKQWPVVVAKVHDLLVNFSGWTTEELKSIHVPVMIVAGDHDAVRLDHITQMFRLIPNSKLAIFPDSGHDLLEKHADWVLMMTVPFFSAPVG